MIKNVINFSIFLFSINRLDNQNNDLLKMDDVICVICDENCNTLSYCCDHAFCSLCFIRYCQEGGDKCPFCRKGLMIKHINDSYVWFETRNMIVEINQEGQSQEILTL